jgi:hypothetical protein
LGAGCGLLPEKLPPDDPRVAELLAVVAAAQHTALGFTRIDTNCVFKLEIARRGGAYDRMLHIYGKTSRTLAFRQTLRGWRWIHEQEIFEGPRDYTNVDGTFRESICLTYERERVAHWRTNQLNISYSGDDLQLAHPRELILADVLPVLAAWGHDISTAPPNALAVRAAITDSVEKRNRISSVPDPFRAVLAVESPAGIGRARLTPGLAGRWPERIVLRLRLAALESFEVSNGAVKILTGFRSQPPFAQTASVSSTGEKTIGEASPYWVFARRDRGENFFELTLPAALLKDAPAALDIQWVDYLR